MAAFQCICCGAIREREARCSCPDCGYPMFPLPYERRARLLQEMRTFLERLTSGEVAVDLPLYRMRQKKDGTPTDERVSKQEDDRRFPGFATIRDYICAAPKTEEFCERLRTSLREIGGHLHTPYSRTYCVDLEPLLQRLAQREEVLQQAMTALGLPCRLERACPPPMTALYSETPDAALLPLAEEILDLLARLTEKLRRFIQQNNLYGGVYKQQTKYKKRQCKDKDPAAVLRGVALQLRRVLDETYVVDLLSDGSKPLARMLQALWQAMDTLLQMPILQKACVYLPTAEGTDQDTPPTDGDRLAAWLNERYRAIHALLQAENFLTDRTEEELFDLYDRLLRLDQWGLMGVGQSALLRPQQSEKKLQALVGLTDIKASVAKIKTYALANREGHDLSLHMCFLGNPGTGKTEVARLIAGILHENHILPTDNVVEVDRNGLVSEYYGATAQKTMECVQRAMGGVLFIDEAYALAPKDSGASDYGREAIAVLLKAMEDHRREFCVILAGYSAPMQAMLSANPGFRSRIPFMLEFPDYTRAELAQIAELMLQKRRYTIGQSALERVLDITDVLRKKPHFANARELRNILEQVILCQTLRCAGTDDRELGPADVERYIKDAGLHLPTADGTAQGAILTGEQQLEQLVGLEGVKRMVKKIRAYAKRNQDDAAFDLHMCFCGAPGTGKTEVARLLSRILFDAGVLRRASFVETDAYGLLGQFVGETASKVEEKIQQAMGGVLFVDEAYGLADASVAGGAGYGQEALTVLLKAMEDHRGQFCVIMAGYRQQMDALLAADPGLASRIQFMLDFPDYSREELGQIAVRVLAKRQYTIATDALQRVLDILAWLQTQPNFANARTLRNLLEQVILDQNLRTESCEADRQIILADVVEYQTEAGIDLCAPAQGPRRIGF